MDSVYEEARRRVKKKKKFYKELTSFVSTSIILIFVNVFSSPGYLWCLWAIVPWGIGLLFRGFSIMMNDSTKDWEKEEMKKEIRSMGRNPDQYFDDTLDLKEIEPEVRAGDSTYRKSDFV